MMRQWCLCVLLLVVSSAVSPQLQILKVERVVSLGGFFSTETIKISYKALQQTSTFLHSVPLEYDLKIARIVFGRSARDSSKSFPYTKSSQIVNGVSMALYRVEVSKIQEHENAELYIQVSNLHRFVNKPKSITLEEDQKVEYEDAKYFVSPYKVREEDNVFKFQKIIACDPDGEKKGINLVTFKNSNTMGYNLIKTKVFGVNHNPLVQFSKVQKVIDVSHWGNIAITQYYSIENKGPSLKGEFSRVAFNSHNVATARTAFRSVDFELPYGVHGLYYKDEVGNVSTSKAYRDDGAQVVRVNLTPRFGILGGWKSNWEIGYNINIEDQLHQDPNHSNQFELQNMNIDYAIKKILSEEYEVKIILPEGAEGVNITLNGRPINSNNVEKQLSLGYLDFVGKPTFNLHNVEGKGKLSVKYQLPTYSVYKKPILLSCFIFAILLFWIALGRIQLSAFRSKTQ